MASNLFEKIFSKGKSDQMLKDQMDIYSQDESTKKAAVEKMAQDSAANLGGTTDMTSEEVQSLGDAQEAIEDTKDMDLGGSMDMAAAGQISEGLEKIGAGPKIRPIKMQAIDTGQPDAQMGEFEARRRALISLAGRQG